MEKPRWVPGTLLTTEDRIYVLAAYVHRMTTENIARWPDMAARVFAGGFRMPIVSDAQWLASTQFAVRKDGHLDGRVQSCRASY